MNELLGLVRRDPIVAAAATVAVIGALKFAAFFSSSMSSAIHRVRFASTSEMLFMSAFHLRHCFGLAPIMALPARSSSPVLP